MYMSGIVIFVLLIAGPFTGEAYPSGAGGPAETLDELAARYADDACKGCHAKIFEEWKDSYHSQSVTHSLPGMRNFVVFGLKEGWKRPFNKEDFMRCFSCHAPQLRDASEGLIRKIGDLIVSAIDGNDAEKSAAKARLAKLNVNCVICHSTLAEVEKNLRGMPQKGVYYGPTGASSAAHGTMKSGAITSPVFCGQCHWVLAPPDGDLVVCNTLYGSYQDAYRANGGSQTCQDCHMRSKGRGHRFPGAYDAEMVREGIGLDVQVSSFKGPAGVWDPTAVVTVGLTNNAGHRIPDG